MRIDTSRLLRLLIGGAFAGLVVFILFSADAARDEEKMRSIFNGKIMDIDAAMQWLKDIQHMLTTPDPSGAFLFTGGFAAMTASALVILDEMSTRWRRMLTKAFLAMAVGMIIGGIIGVGIDFIGTRMAKASLLLLPVAQLLLFPLIGFSAGAAVGIVLGTWRRTAYAMVGGLIGGAVGGLAMQLIGSMTAPLLGNGSIGRFFGFIAMGAIVGVSVAFIEEAGKRSWVTILNGPKEGRQYILSKPQTTIGRSEFADIPLFGDMSVAKDHARISVLGYLVGLQATGGDVTINGNNVKSAELHASDTISIGRHRLRFHQRWEYRAASQVRYQPAAYQQVYANQPQPTPMGYVPAQTSAFALTASGGGLSLMVSGGPHINQRFTLPLGTHHIGRESDCAVFLPNDTVVSRTHAELIWNGSQWIVRDLSSRHGLWINGTRISEHALNIGEQIGVGQTWLRVDSI